MMKVLVVAFLSVSLSGCSSWFWQHAVPEEDRASLRYAAKTAAACSASQLLQTPLLHKPLYFNNSGLCEAAQLRNKYWHREFQPKQFYSDALCQNPVDFELTTYADFCHQYTSKGKLGDASDIAFSESGWTLNPATRFNIGIDTVRGNKQPFMKRVNFRTVTAGISDQTPPDIEGKQSPLYHRRATGLCHLEMRIYKKDLAENNLKPLLFFHGGEWRWRGFGFFGMETQISDLTEQGFIVFAPSYRLAGQSDGPVECQSANWRQILSDADAALTWVTEHGQHYGAKRSAVTLVSHSAGGMLASHVMTNSPQAVNRSLMLYPALDSQDFIEMYRQGEITSERGANALASFLNRADLNQPLDQSSIAATSFPTKVAQQPKLYPPVFLIHGGSDQLVPAEQSIRLCNALSGNADQGPASGIRLQQSDHRRQLVACDDQSRFAFIPHGKHMLDVCIKHVECPAGSGPSQTEISKTLKEARLWLAN